ncbi:MAG: RNA polymerase sigma factor [Mangrovibacterium sp.]
MKQNDKHEGQLIADLKKGDTSAFETIFRLYSGQLFRFARSYFHTNEDAEEIIQDVFLKLWKHKESIYSSDSLKSYLFQIAYRTIKETFIRKNREDKYKQRIALEYLKAESPELEQADYKLVMKAVDRLIETLPAQRQNIFILNKKEGLTISEIAVYLNITEKTVKNHLSLAMAQLRNEARQKGMAQLLFFFLFYKR